MPQTNCWKFLNFKCIIEKLFLPIIFIIPFLASCDSLDPKQQRFDKMCDCMGQSENGLSDRAANELLGNSVMNLYAIPVGMACAQELMEKENLTLSESMLLYKEFAETPCGKKFHIDAASIKQSEQEAKDQLKSIIENDDPSTKISDDARDELNSIVGYKDSIHVISVENLDSVKSSKDYSKPMSDSEAQKLYDENVVPILNQIQKNNN